MEGWEARNVLPMEIYDHAGSYGTLMSQWESGVKGGEFY